MQPLVQEYLDLAQGLRAEMDRLSLDGPLLPPHPLPGETAEEHYRRHELAHRETVDEAMLDWAEGIPVEARAPAPALWMKARLEFALDTALTVAAPLDGIPLAWLPQTDDGHLAPDWKFWLLTEAWAEAGCEQWHRHFAQQCQAARLGREAGLQTGPLN